VRPPAGQSAQRYVWVRIVRKMQMRAQRERRQRRERPLLCAQIWVGLGPAPLISDTTSSGWVSGRATSVANRSERPDRQYVYLGGAFGGVWKSTNAAAVPRAP